jgi:hypothetical protein
VKVTFIWAPLLVALSLPACTAELGYNTVQASQRYQCGKLPDKADFDRCMSKTDTTYESYKRQREPEQK